MIKTENFLVEIQTEELPPKALSRLASSFSQEIQERLLKAQLTFKSAEWYATPRRLTVLVTNLIAQQPDANVERRGPALDAAFDAQGKPTPACAGFARSCNVTPEQLTRIKTDQGEWVGFQQNVMGKATPALLPAIVEEALAALPIPKRMRWGSGSVEFVRPVHAVILLYGADVVETEILSVRAGRETSGHRFHCKKMLSIARPEDYLKTLETDGFVMADFVRRKALILAQTQALVQKTFGDEAHAVISDALLDEVTGLVEWPVAVLGNFDQRFLEVPAEALISAMQDHQRYFAIMDKQGKLLPHFITISNIQSQNPKGVVAGNERVLRARLADATFFYETDKKHSLESRLDILKTIIFQAKLGTLYDKAQRLAKLAGFIAQASKENIEQAARAGLLAKTDLTTAMVNEFPELQGIAGYYYALNDGESKTIAEALNEQYMPRFSGDALPATRLGCVLALADRIDTLVGVFGINQQPTGDKDPFALRRAALGVLRILIEKQLDLDLRVLIRAAIDGYGEKLENSQVLEQVLNFIQERLKPWYQEQGVSHDVFAAVAALGVTRPYDFHRRIQAVQHFKELPNAESLSVANKRVSNILAKVENQIRATEINPQLFAVDAERELAAQVTAQSHAIAPLYQEARYVDVLSQLASLRQPVDDFFEKVMVMTDDDAQRENRLLLLMQLRALFLQVADVALLQTG